MIESRWYKCRLNGTEVYLWGPQLEFFRRFYGADAVEVMGDG